MKKGRAEAAALRLVLEEAVSRHAAPGAAASVALGGDGPRLTLVAGRLLHEPDAAKVDERTVFDLASLTKVLAGALLSARAVVEGRLSLEETPWPSWPGVTPAHVLAHEAGLPAWRPLFQAALDARAAGLSAGRRIVVEAALAVSPEAAPGARTLYSDLGMIALGALLEERYGAPLDVLFDETARRAFGETGLRYVRIADVGYHPMVPRVAPTARCPWRSRVVVGQVHDDNAFAMGGVAAHAGLFGSVEDVAAAAGGLLAMIQRGGSPLADAVRAFARRPGARALGFDRPTPGGSTGNALSASSVGHLGFTGTSIWIDPEAARGRGAAYVLLTHRVHPDPTSEGIKALRPAFHQAAARWIEAVAR